MKFVDKKILVQTQINIFLKKAGKISRKSCSDIFVIFVMLEKLLSVEQIDLAQFVSQEKKKSKFNHFSIVFEVSFVGVPVRVKNVCYSKCY